MAQVRETLSPERARKILANATTRILLKESA